MNHSTIKITVITLATGLVLSACNGSLEPKSEPSEKLTELSQKVSDPVEYQVPPLVTEETKDKELPTSVTEDAVKLVLEKKTDQLFDINKDNIVYFKINKFSTPKEYEEVLLAHVEYLKQHPDMIVNVSGHADTSGNPKINKKLSEKRAKSIATFFTKHGISEAQIQIASFGDNLPLKDMENMDENRRVELHYSQIYTLK